MRRRSALARQGTNRGTVIDQCRGTALLLPSCYRIVSIRRQTIAVVVERLKLSRSRSNDGGQGRTHRDALACNAEELADSRITGLHRNVILQGYPVHWEIV